MSRPQQISRTLRRRAVLGCAVLAVTGLALTGCAAGQGAETAQQVAAVNGPNVDVGPIALRDAVFAYPGGENAFGYRAGGDAALRITIVNSGVTADELVSVTSPVASRVTVEGVTTIPAGFSVSSIPDTDNTLAANTPASPSPQVTSSPTATPAPSASPAPSATPTAPSAPAAASIDGGELRIVLRDLREPIRPGINTPVTFRFRHAGEVTLQVPINAPAEAAPSGAQAGHGSGHG